jgi:hypothetical protein
MAITLSQLGRMSDAELVDLLEEMLANGLHQAADAVQAELDRRSVDDPNVTEGPVTSTEQLTTNVTSVIGPGFGGGGSFLLNGAVGAVAGRLIGGRSGALIGTILGLVLRPIGPATVPAAPVAPVEVVP